MNSKVYLCTVDHSRHHPFKHVFRYPYFMLAVDLSELKTLHSFLPLFGYNKSRPYSIYDRDYTLSQDGSIEEKVRDLIDDCIQPDLSISRIVLLTAPRLFRLGFNPVSFYYCYSNTEELVCVLAEVNNTFMERHLYPLLAPSSGLSDTSFRVASEKVFHVSPFITREGAYSFEIGPLSDNFEISINLSQSDRRVLSSRLVGTAHPFNTQTLLRGLRTHSFTRLMTLPRIHKQAALLYFGKKAAFIPQAPPISDRTISLKRPGLINSRAWTLIERMMGQITEGGLTFRLPNGLKRHFGSPDSPTQEEITIHDFRVFRKTILGGDVAFGEAYMEGMWDSRAICLVSSLSFCTIAITWRIFVFPWLGWSSW